MLQWGHSRDSRAECPCRIDCLLVDLGKKLVVAEKRVFILADLDGAATILCRS